MRVKEKQRKKFHWWYIPLGIVLVLVLTAGGPCAVDAQHAALAEHGGHDQ